MQQFVLVGVTAGIWKGQRPGLGRARTLPEPANTGIVPASQAVDVAEDIRRIVYSGP